MVAGDEHDRVAGVEERDQRVLDPRVLVEHPVEPLDRELLGVGGAVADLDVPKIDEVAVDDQLPGTRVDVVVEEVRERLLDPRSEVHVLTAAARLEVRAQVQVADQQQISHAPTIARQNAEHAQRSPQAPADML